MNIKFPIITGILMLSGWGPGFFANAQTGTQEELFQKYQAMVIIEEANQHCPLLSRLEAEVLNGQIVFANDTFSGKLDAVEKFKKEARIFARRSACNSEQILGLIGLARQQANDSMINHLLLARQIHLLDKRDRERGEIEGGILLKDLKEEDWSLLDNFFEEVKENYLSQATTEDWDAFLESVIEVAQERTAQEFTKNENMVKLRGGGDIDSVQARARISGIRDYYLNLDKSVRAFIEGANADETGFPYSRPANDFTNWTSYRPRNGDINWVLSYPGCGGTDHSECNLFTTVNGDIGLVLAGDVRNVIMEFRNPDDNALYSTNKAVEGPIGSNELNMQNMNDNLQTMLDSKQKETVKAASGGRYDRYLAQVGNEPVPGTDVYIFPEGTLNKIEQLKKNDVLKLTVDVRDENGHSERTYIIPVHNYHRARNWAYSTQ